MTDTHESPTVEPNVEIQQPRLRKTGGTIAFLLPGLAGGGAERSAIGLAAAVRDLGRNVELVVPSAEGPLKSVAVESLGEESIVDLGTQRIRRSIPALARYIRRRRPQVIVVAPDDTVVFAAVARWMAGRSKTRVISVICNTMSVKLGRLGFKGALLKPVLRSTLPRVDLVVCKSEGSAQDLVERIVPLRRLVVIPNQVDFDEIHRKAKMEVAHPWIDGGFPIILGVGRLEQAKDFSTLLRAFALVKDHVPAAKLIILGEGSERGALEALASKLGLAGDVDLPGFVGNPWAYMARSRVFVLSSIHEGLPRVVVEALGCGVPVVATDCPSGPREILKGGELGTLIPVGDPRVMSAAITTVLMSDVEGRGPGKLVDELSPARIASRYLEEIELLSGSA